MPRRRKGAALRRLGCAALLGLNGAAFAADGSCPIPGAPPAETQETVRDRDTWSREAAQPLPASRLDAGRVAAILASLEAPPRKASWWERFNRWLESWLGRAGEDADAPEWLAKLLGGIPPWAAKLVFWLVLGALVAGLAAIAVIELRAAGVLRRQQPRPAAAAPGAARETAREAPDLAFIGRLPARDQPAALLQWAIRRLVARRILPADRSLTNGELAAVLRTHAPAELPLFQRLACAAEAAVYGARAPAADEVRALLDAVGTPPATA